MELTEEQRQIIQDAIFSIYPEGFGIANPTSERRGFITGMKEVLTNPEKYGLIPVSKHTKPYRVGKKQHRAILDANGIEVLVFPQGKEADAIEYCNYLNRKEDNHEQ